LPTARAQPRCPKARDKLVHNRISVPGSAPDRPEERSWPHKTQIGRICPREQSANTHRVHMAILLASSSPVRLQLLRAAGLSVEAISPRVDEETARLALQADGASPRDIADTLAEMKARKIAERFPTARAWPRDLCQTRNAGCGQRPAFRTSRQDAPPAVGHRGL
jgi:Maf-like protein